MAAVNENDNLDISTCEPECWLKDSDSQDSNAGHTRSSDFSCCICSICVPMQRLREITC